MFRTTRLHCILNWFQLIAWTAAAVVCVACGGESSSPSSSERPHIVLITVDSLRPDHVGAYGYDRATSPSIDTLAEQGAVFEVATSSSSWTLPAQAALFTGLPDYVHGVDRGSRPLLPDRRTLAEAMQSAGYRTVGIWSSPLLDPSFGFDQGFETYVSARRTVGTVGESEGSREWDLRLQLSYRDINGPAVLGKVDAALAVEDERPLFLFIHLSDVHYNFMAPEPYGSMFAAKDYAGGVVGAEVDSLTSRIADSLAPHDLQHVMDLYDGEVAWADHQVGRILASLEARGLTDRTAVVLTSQHGIELFDHGTFGHRKNLYDSSIRIPLVVRYPGHVDAGQRLTAPAQIIDIAPTLLEWARAEPLPEIVGRPLQPILRGETPNDDDDEPVAVAELGREVGRPLFAVRTPTWKAISQGKDQKLVELFNLETDPAEQHNLVGVDPQLTQVAEVQLQTTVGELRDRRLQHVRPTLGTGRLDGATEAALVEQGHFAEANPIWADPNPIEVCAGERDPPMGVTTLSWNAVEAEGPMEVWVWPDGNLFTTRDVIWSEATGDWVRDGLEFALVDTATGEEVGRTRISVVEVECQDQ